MAAPIVAGMAGAAAGTIGAHVVKYAARKAKNFVLHKAVSGVSKGIGAIQKGIHGVVTSKLGPKASARAASAAKYMMNARRKSQGGFPKSYPKNFKSSSVKPPSSSTFMNPERRQSIAYAGHAAMKVRR